MSDIQAMAKRLGELERVRADMGRYSHHDDAHNSQALALKYIRGTSAHDTAIAIIGDGLDEMIAKAKRELREALQ